MKPSEFLKIHFSVTLLRSFLNESFFFWYKATHRQMDRTIFYFYFFFFFYLLLVGNVNLLLMLTWETPKLEGKIFLHNTYTTQNTWGVTYVVGTHYMALTPCVLCYASVVHQSQLELKN
jgi:hypothetical protein